jgi:hypothetical protein
MSWHHKSLLLLLLVPSPFLSLPHPNLCGNEYLISRPFESSQKV